MQVAGVEEFKKDVPVKVMIELLRQAVLEEDPEKRFPPIKEACKIITSAIPYKKRLRGFTKEKELLFHLMLLEIFNKKTIQLIMTTLLAKLPEFPDFIYLFYHGFLEIAQCPESQIQRYGVEYKLPNAPQLVKYVDPEYKRELNRDILKYIKYIKETSFEYFKRFVLENTEGILLYDANIDLLKVIVAFVKNTQLPGFTNKVCALLEQLLANPYGNKLIKNKRLATEMLNALNISENTVRRIINKFPTKAEKAERALKQSTTTAHTLRKISSTSMLQQQQQQASFSRSVSNFDNSLTDLSPKKSNNAGAKEGFNNSDEESVVIDENEEDEEDEEILIGNLQRLEDWLLESSKFSLLEDDVLLHFFRENKQLIIFIKMILDPFEADCSTSFYSSFEALAPRINKVPFQLVNFNFKPLPSNNPTTEEKLTDKHKFESLYMYRAYLCKRILDDDFNWDQIMLGAPHFISEFFSSMYQALQSPHPRVNIHIVLEIIEIFLRRDPEQTLLNIIQSQIPFIFLYNIQTPSVRDFLINLINLPQNYYNMDSNSLFRLAKYLKFSNFFLDFLNLLLDKNYQFDTTKMNLTNKHDELADIYDAIHKMSSHLINTAYKAKKIPQVCAINRKKLKKSHPKDSDELLAEERLGLESDIDRIMPFLNHETSISHIDTSSIGSSPRLPTVQSSVPSHPRISGLERPTVISMSPQRNSSRIYPSMLESIKNEEEARLRDKTPIPSATNISRYSKRGGISPMTPVAVTPSRRKPKLIRELSDENLSISHDISRTNNGTPLPLYNEKERSSVTIPAGAERHSSITNTITSEDIPQGPYQYNFLNEAPTPVKKERRSERLMGVRRKSRDSTTAVPSFHQYNSNTLLKVVHPDVKQSVYVNHFQHLNAPLTQSILGVHALPSKSMTRSASLPALTKPAKETKVLDEPVDESQRKVMFSQEEIKKSEEQSYPLAVAMHDIIQMYFENYKPTGLMTKIGIKSTANLRIISCIQGNQDVKFFAILLKNYLLKFAHSIEQEESSSAICGKIINNLLSRLNDYKSFKNLSTSIHAESCNYIFLLGKVLAESIKWKPKSKPRVYLQNYVVHEIFGSNRLTLLTTLYHILQNDSVNNYKILTQLPEPFWHTLAYWFVELKHQNMFLNVTTKIFRIALRHGPETLLLKILVKVNILSMLKTAYRDVCVDPTCGKMLRTESFLLSLKEFALDVDYIQTNRCELSKINGFLDLFDSWKILKKGLLGADDVLRLTTNSSVSLFRKTRSRNNSPADNKFIHIPNPENESQFKKESSTVSLKKLIEKRVERAPSQDLMRLKINTERGSEKKGSLLEVPGMTSRAERLLEHSETAKKIILPSMPKENRNHRAQTTLRVRQKTNLRI